MSAPWDDPNHDVLADLKEASGGGWPLTERQNPGYPGRMTNEEIGQLIGLTHSGVSRIRSGGRIPNLDTMTRIEQATGWSIEKQSRAAAGGREHYAAEFDKHVTNGKVKAAR